MGLGDELAMRRAAYLRTHSAHLEAVLADAVNSVLASRPKDVIAQLAAELAVQAGLSVPASTPGSKGRLGGPASHGTAEGLERALQWNIIMEEEAMNPIEAAIEASLEATLRTLPDNPLAYVAHQVTELAISMAGAGKSGAAAMAYREAIFCEARRLGGHS